MPLIKPHHESRWGGWLDLAMQVGLTLALSVVLLTLGGRWLDAKLGTEPWLMIIGILWGAGGGTWWVILRVKRYSEEEERREQEEKIREREN